MNFRGKKKTPYVASNGCRTFSGKAEKKDGSLRKSALSGSLSRAMNQAEIRISPLSALELYWVDGD